MPYTQSQQETLQAGRQQLKVVAQARSCDRVPPKQWSRCNRQDLLEICSLDQQGVLCLLPCGSRLHALVIADERQTSFVVSF